jgi:hypothetical protein
MLDGQLAKCLHPTVPRLLPDGVFRGRKIRIGKRSNGDSEQPGISFRLPINGRAASWAELEGDRFAAVGHALELRCVARDGSHLGPLEPSLITENRSGSPLTLKAMARRNPHRLAFAREVQLATIACSVTDRHGSPGTRRCVEGICFFAGMCVCGFTQAYQIMYNATICMGCRDMR